jgi:hypothetical protein
MRLPNKVTTFKESDLAKYPIVLMELERHDMTASELYVAIKPKLGSINEYVGIIDALYALGKLKFDAEGKVLSYVA